MAAVLLSVALIPISVVQGQQGLPPFVFGTWRIYEFKEVGGHLHKDPELAQRAIGKQMRIDRKSFAYDSNIPSFGETVCSHVGYKFEIRRLKEYERSKQGNLEFYGIEGARKNLNQNLVVLCGRRTKYYFEVAKGNRLALYYDGWFFFFEKALTTR